MPEPTDVRAELVAELQRLGVPGESLCDLEVEQLAALKDRWLRALMAEPPRTRE